MKARYVEPKHNKNEQSNTMSDKCSYVTLHISAVTKGLELNSVDNPVKIIQKGV